ncbi:hypothetical protein ES332_A05G292600v1 [Gossypium tomentosum]|uniref:Reverse transcriptase zinc-binding domain-containing protein n=1 Tax=Gossypium tomentosum TaxID=34277 RepID=A0A5D2QKD1_GOSTO|nr:hypothetical protein ES332_A05G292600v1 [Gossypium tomentosum]
MVKGKGCQQCFFFHKAVKIKAKRKIGGHWFKEPKEIKEGLFNFFKNHFDCPTRRWKMELDLKFRKLNKERSMKLEEPFSMEESKEAVWSCNESKAPGLDDFNLCFFRKCWEIVKNDLFRLMFDFFHIRKA